MKIPNIGDLITLPGTSNTVSLICTGYEYDADGNISGYNVAPQEDPYITFGRVIYSTPIEQ